MASAQPKGGVAPSAAIRAVGVIRMHGAQPTRGQHGGGRYRWAFAYSIGGDLRFISHHDTLRLFRRAVARASLPVRYSEGFNPHPRITIPVPRPVGVASCAESIIIETERSIDPNDALECLQRHTPADICMSGVRRLKPDERPQPDRVRYRLDLGDATPRDLDDRIRRVLESEVVQVERSDPSHNSVRTLDIRSFLVDLHAAGGAVEFTLRVTDAGTAKPAEIAALLGCDASSINHRIQRLEIYWR